MTIVDDVDGGVKFSEVIKIDEGKVRQHVEEVVRSSVEETLNGLLEAEADELCGAKRYERSPERLDTRSGHYERKLATKAGPVTLKVPRLRSLPFETQIIERYKRREASVEEAMIESRDVLLADLRGAAGVGALYCRGFGLGVAVRSVGAGIMIAGGGRACSKRSQGPLLEP